MVDIIALDNGVVVMDDISMVGGDMCKYMRPMLVIMSGSMRVGMHR